MFPKGFRKICPLELEAWRLSDFHWTVWEVFKRSQSWARNHKRDSLKFKVMALVIQDRSINKENW